MKYSCPCLDRFFDTAGPIVPAVIAVVLFLAVAIFLAIIIIKAFLFCKIFANAGYHWAWGLLVLVPIVGVVMLFVLAFGRWPVRKELKELRSRLSQSSS